MTFSTCNRQAAPFWLVWCPTGSRPPRYLHYSRESAEQEADRLAHTHPGKTFFVVETRYSVNVGAQRITYINPDEVPF